MPAGYFLVHAAHAAAHGSSGSRRLGLGQFSNGAFGGQQESGHGGSVLQSETGHLLGVDDTGGHEVFVFAGSGVEAEAVLAFTHLFHHHGAFKAGVGGNLEVAQGDASVVVGHEGVFDVVLANINRNVLLDGMPRFREVMREGGMLALSGFYTADIGIVEKRANEFGLELVARKEENGWACLVFKLR